jgi:hypothetical protein
MRTNFEEIEPLEAIDAPGVESWPAGIVAGGAALGIGIAITPDCRGRPRGHRNHLIQPRSLHVE